MPISGSSKWEQKMIFNLFRRPDGEKPNRTPAPEAAGFQPDAIELENREPPISLHISWFLVIGALLFLLAWASFTEVDKIVTAEGKITTVRPPITMKPLDRTTIRKVHVKVGQKVRQGDLLFTFDQTVNQQELSRLREQLRSYEAEKKRLTAELNGYRTPPDFGSRPEEQRQKQLYLSRKGYYEQKLRSYDETIRRYERTFSSLEGTLTRYENRQAALRKIEDMYKVLHERKAASLKELLSTQIEVIGTGIQLDNQKLSIVESHQNVLATRAERDAFVSDWTRQISESLVAADRSIISYQREIPKYEMFVSMTEMRAPCNSVVHELAPFQEGSAVREAEALVSLIPSDVENYVAEIDIPAQDISWIHIGSRCRLKLDAFPFQQCGTLNGEILYISHDAFKRGDGSLESRNDDGGVQSASSRGVTYQAQLKISGKLTGRGAKATLLPGMRLKAEISVGKRRIISYIFNPFIKAIDESIREP